MTSRLEKPDTDADTALRKLLAFRHPSNFIMKAGAGSGKTTSLIKALDHIRSSQGSKLRQQGQKIACITYTEVAAQEIWADVNNDGLMHVSTIHSFLWSVMDPFQDDIGMWIKSYVKGRLNTLEEQRMKFSARHAAKTIEKNARDIERFERDLAVVDGISNWTYGIGSNYSRGVLGHSDILRMVPDQILQKDLLATLVSRRFPYILVDESQDTMPNVVQALKRISTLAAGRFCLGFFGDPMQQIFSSGIGNVAQEPGWELITKEENFRNPPAVLEVVNKVRLGGDGLLQTDGLASGGGPRLSGVTTLLILPSARRGEVTLRLVRDWIAREYGDLGWKEDHEVGGAKILVVVHRMAALHLGFINLFESFNLSSGSLATAFNEGTSWLVRPFLKTVLPLVTALTEGRDAEVMQILLRTSPSLRADRNVTDMSTLLAELQVSLVQLSHLLRRRGEATIREVLIHLKNGNLMELDERLTGYLEAVDLTEEETAALAEREKERVATISAFFRAPARELWSYAKYVNEQSPFSTQQGIKGAEFDRVLVLIDDEDHRHPFFSYDRLFGLTPATSGEEQNQRIKKDTVTDRTRRLFYVCCSRAMRHLAVVIYTPDVPAALSAISATGLFDTDQIFTADDVVAG